MDYISYWNVCLHYYTSGRNYPALGDLIRKAVSGSQFKSYRLMKFLVLKLLSKFEDILISATRLFVCAATVCQRISKGFSAEDLLPIIIQDEGMARTPLWRYGNMISREPPTKNLDMIDVHPSIRAFTQE